MRPDRLRVPRPSRALLLLCALFAGACSDSGGPTQSAPPQEAPRAPVILAAVSCSAQPATRSVRCGQGALPRSARGYIIVGGQGQYVQVTSSNPDYNAGTQIFSFGITLQNLIPQPMGTTDGTTPDGAAVRIVFDTGPTVNSGSGAITVANAAGTGSYTGANQPYFMYSGAQLGADGILSQNETTAGETWQLNVPTTVNSFVFTLLIVAEVPKPNGYIDVTPAADTMLAGGSQALTATVRTAVGDVVPAQPISWGTGNGAVATVDGSGNVTGVAPGAVSITATSGARSGAAAIAVCPNLAVGGVYVATSLSVCIGTGGAAAEYTVTPVNLGVANGNFDITGSGIVAVTGPPSPNRLPAGGPRLSLRGGPTPDDAFHAALQERSLRESRRLLGSGAALLRPGGGPRGAITPGVPVVGAVMSLNVSQSACSPLDTRTATVKSVGTHIIMMEDNSNPSGGFSTGQYDALAATFDTLVYPAVAGNFGAPFDIDSNSRVIALYTAAVNDLTPPASSSYVGGFFYSRDLIPVGSCSGSNQGEMFYMLAPDPTGAHGNVRSATFVEGVTVGTLGHEFQHLINASRRIYGGGGPFPLEQVWLNEGLSHIAEEEVYYASALHGPGENIGVAAITANQTQQDRFFQFAEANFGRLRQWLLRPDTAGAFKNADNLAIRGASWAFLRYAADRKGGIESDLWSGLAFSADTGLTNLTNRLGTPALPWFRDFAAAMYLDDAGLSPAVIYRQPSWDFRGIYAALDYDPGPACSCAYELQMRNPANGVNTSFSVSQGAGAGYVRMGVAASAFAKLTMADGTPGTTLAVVVMRTK